MISNVGAIDRIIRLVLAGGLLYQGLSTYPGTALGVGLDVIGVIALATGLVGFCGLYRLLGFNTCKSN